MVALLKRAGVNEEDDDDEQILALAEEIKGYVRLINPRKVVSDATSIYVDWLSLPGPLPLLSVWRNRRT